MNKEEICFKIKSGKIISNLIKKNFSEDVHTKIEAKKSQKLINRNTIENFVPRLKPKKTNRIPSPLKLNKNKNINEGNNENIKLKKEILSEKENSSFIDDSEIYSSSSDEDIIFKDEKGELEKSFSTNERSPEKDENSLEQSEKYLIINKDVNDHCSKTKNEKCIKNIRNKMCNIKNSINVNNIQKSSKNNIKIKYKNYSDILEDKDNEIINNENLNSRIKFRNENKKTSILDVLINIRGN
jgi:hypothetical protein